MVIELDFEEFRILIFYIDFNFIDVEWMILFLVVFLVLNLFSFYKIY